MERRHSVAACAVIFAASFIFVSGASCEPDLEISGIIKDKNGSLAMINDQIVKEGDTVSGVQVIKIEDEGVRFSFEKKEFFRRVSGPFKIEAAASTKGKGAPAGKGKAAGKGAAAKATASLPAEVPNVTTMGQLMNNPDIMAQMMQSAAVARTQANRRMQEVNQQVKAMEEGDRPPSAGAGEGGQE